MFNARIGHGLTEKKKENLLTAIYIGSIFIILAVIYIAHLPSSLWDQILNFFMSLTLAPVPGTGIALPAPSNPAAHIELYTAAFQFAIAIGIIEIVVLVLRVLLQFACSTQSRNHRKHRILARNKLPHNNLPSQHDDCRRMVRVLGRNNPDLRLSPTRTLLCAACPTLKLFSFNFKRPPKRQ